ncbi:mitochondrial import receptor subunit TOM20 homolog [Drosophila tropicalis]|uniref:mitochondrial import receptor subunit TOM20 homolog n=1 Tax=Drosophila tropicalis TaxID=46794 RepID=UPI0035AB68C4
MSLKSLIISSLCTATAFCLGYCIYFDRKRRNDPQYKSKVHKRREREQLKQMELHRQGNYSQQQRQDVPPHHEYVIRSGTLPDVTDHAALERYFLNEIKLGDQLISQGLLDEGLGHLANAIVVCAQPDALIQMLQSTLPEKIFRPLMQKLQEAQLQTRGSIPSSSSAFPESHRVNATAAD